MPSDETPLRFLADMGVSQRVVEYLRAEGHDAVHLRDQGLQRMPDAAICAKAIEANRIILTFDLDFGEIAASAGVQTVSVILLRLPNARAVIVIERLIAVSSTLKDDLKTGIIVTVEPTRFRVRRLPI